MTSRAVGCRMQSAPAKWRHESLRPASNTTEPRQKFDACSVGVDCAGRLAGVACAGYHMSESDELTDLSEEQLAVDPRIGMRRLAFEFLLQQEYFSTAATMVAEFIVQVQRLEAAESSGNLSVPSLRSAAIVWRREVRGFKYWYGADDDSTIARMMQELTDKGMQTFISELAVELQVNHP